MLTLHAGLILEFPTMSLELGPKLQIPNSELSGDAKWCGFAERALVWKSKCSVFILILPLKSCVTLDKSLPIGGLQFPSL